MMLVTVLACSVLKFIHCSGDGRVEEFLDRFVREEDPFIFQVRVFGNDEKSFVHTVEQFGVLFVLGLHLQVRC